MEKFYTPYEAEIKKCIKIMIESGMTDDEIKQLYLNKLDETLSENKYLKIVNTIKVSDDELS